MILDFLQRISPVVHAEAPRRPRLAREVIARQIGNDVIIVDDAGFDEALLIAENASDRRSAAFFRRHAPPIGHWSRAGENKLQGLQEVGTIAFVPREVMAVLTRLPTVRNMLAHVIVAARRPKAEGPRTQRCERQSHWQTITFVAGLRHDAMVAPMVVEGPITGDMFLAYVEQCLVPTIKRGDIVVMDHA